MDSAIVLAVQDGGQVYVLPVQSGKGQLLEVVQSGINFIRGRCLFSSPRDNSRGIPLLERQRVGQGREQLRISPQHLHSCPQLALVIVGAHQVGPSFAARARAVGQKFNVHLSSPLWALAWVGAVAGGAEMPPWPRCSAGTRAPLKPAVDHPYSGRS